MESEKDKREPGGSPSEKQGKAESKAHKQKAQKAKDTDQKEPNETQKSPPPPSLPPPSPKKRASLRVQVPANAPSNSSSNPLSPTSASQPSPQSPQMAMLRQHILQHMQRNQQQQQQQQNQNQPEPESLKQPSKVLPSPTQAKKHDPTFSMPHTPPSHLPNPTSPRELPPPIPFPHSQQSGTLPPLSPRSFPPPPIGLPPSTSTHSDLPPSPRSFLPQQQLAPPPLSPRSLPRLDPDYQTYHTYHAYQAYRAYQTHMQEARQAYDAFLLHQAEIYPPLVFPDSPPPQIPTSPRSFLPPPPAFPPPSPLSPRSFPPGIIPHSPQSGHHAPPPPFLARPASPPLKDKPLPPLSSSQVPPKHPYPPSVEHHESQARPQQPRTPQSADSQRAQPAQSQATFSQAPLAKKPRTLHWHTTPAQIQADAYQFMQASKSAKLGETLKSSEAETGKAKDGQVDSPKNGTLDQYATNQDNDQPKDANNQTPKNKSKAAKKPKKRKMKPTEKESEDLQDTQDRLTGKAQEEQSNSPQDSDIEANTETEQQALQLARSLTPAKDGSISCSFEGCKKKYKRTHALQEHLLFHIDQPLFLQKKEARKRMMEELVEEEDEEDDDGSQDEEEKEFYYCFHPDCHKRKGAPQEQKYISKATLNYHTGKRHPGYTQPKGENMEPEPPECRWKAGFARLLRKQLGPETGPLVGVEKPLASENLFLFLFPPNVPTDPAEPQVLTHRFSDKEEFLQSFPEHAMHKSLSISFGHKVINSQLDFPLDLVYDSTTRIVAARGHSTSKVEKRTNLHKKRTRNAEEPVPIPQERIFVPYDEGEWKRYCRRTEF